MPILLLGFRDGQLEPAQVAAVEQAAPRHRVVVTRDQEEIERLLGEIEVVAGQFPRELLARAPGLRWYQQWGAGSDWLLRHPQAVEADFVLTNVSGVHAIPISEHILALMLAFARSLPLAFTRQRKRQWKRDIERRVFELAGKELLLLGVGAIGARTARSASALGMRVVGVRRDPTRDVAGVEEMNPPDALPRLLPHADFVVLTLPLTRETERMIGERELRAMKESAYLINIGRGGTVHEEALIRALREGWIAGAGLDVFEQEPLPKESELWGLENVIITSHYSGSNPHYNERALEIFLDNLRRYRSQEPLRNVVDKERGY